MIWLLGFYMWLSIHRPYEYYPALGALHVEAIYMLFLIAYWLAAPNKHWPINRMQAAVLFFTFAFVVSWAVSPFAAQPMCVEVVESFASILVFYFLVVTCVREEKDLKLLVLFFIGAVGLYMSHSMLEYCNGRHEWRMGISRMIGVDLTHNNPNAFAATLVFALPFTLPLWATKPSPLVCIGLIGFTLGAIACILLTGSRSGLVGLLAFGMLFLSGTRYRKTGMVLLAGAACVAVVALPGELQNRFMTLIDSSYGPSNAEVSAQGRFDGLMAGLKLLSRVP